MGPHSLQGGGSEETALPSVSVPDSWPDWVLLSTCIFSGMALVHCAALVCLLV